MRITCPQCGFFRELPDNKIPVTSTKATCPKCGHRFKFRPDNLSAPASGLHDREPASPTSPEGISSWRRSGPAPSNIDQPVHSGRHHFEPEEYDDPASEPPRTTRPVPHDTDTGPDPYSHHDADLRPDPSTTYPEETPPIAEEHQAPSAVGHRASHLPEEEHAPTPRTRSGQPLSEDEPEPLEPSGDFYEPESSTDLRSDHGRGMPPREESHDDDTAAPPVGHGDTRGESPRQDDPQSPKEASSGQGADGVRDIWARLKAMDSPSRKQAADSRQTPQREPEEEQEPSRQDPRETVSDPIPWERLDAYGFLPGLFLTLRKILFSPLEFFGAMPEGRPKGKALVFNLLISEFLLVIDFLWTLTGLRGRIGDPGQADALGAVATTPGLGFLIALLLVPLAIACGIYLDAWLTHLLLLLFRSAKKGFNETFRVMCYSAAPTVLSAIPVAGQILSPVILVWYMALQAIGLKKVHDGAYTQTLAAIFIKWSLYLFVLLAMLQNFAPGR